tara:strand:+ start:6521 stop:6826 length:306 start_codon:yes stop_codon:yes gene_type:complete
MENTIKNLEAQYQAIINDMTIEQIEQRSLLVSMSAPTQNNILFQKLLTDEYNYRIGLKRYDELYKKVKNNTITKKERRELEILAFGEDFVNDKNPNKKWRA